MNGARRKKIDQALEILREVHDEEEEAFQNLPESLRDAARGAIMEEAIEHIGSAIDELERVVDGAD